MDKTVTAAGMTVDQIMAAFLKLARDARRANLTTHGN